MRAPAAILAWAAALSWASPATATSTLMESIPNGPRVGCVLCHQGGTGGAPRNAFGALIEAAKTWAEIYTLDTDGDGYTNGEELGDPNGTGVGDVTFSPTLPADDTSFPCGSHALEGPEVCDGLELDGETCLTQGYAGGTLRCSDSCDGYVTDGCTNNLDACGNSRLDSGEECDDGAANSDTVPDACRTDCRAPSCGDQVKDGGEECDWGDFASDIEPDRCRLGCWLPVCGDGVVDALLGETCDAGPANSDTRPGACRTTCTRAGCGDGVVDAGEVCDDGNTDDGDACSADCSTAYGASLDSLVANTGCAAGPSRSLSPLLLCLAIFGLRRRSTS